MSAFVIVKQPQALPGHCFKCRSSDRDFFVDLIMSEDFYGAVYICSECLLEMANLAGYVSPDQASQMAERYAAIGIENIELRGKLEGLEDIYATVCRVFPERLTSIVSADAVSGQTSLPINENPAETLSAGSGQTPQDADGGKRELESGTTIVAEQSNEQGLADVPNTGVQPFKLGLG